MFYFYFFKTKVYLNPPRDLDELKEKNELECKNIPQEIIKEASATNLQKQLDLCFNQSGTQFEHLM